MMLKSFSTNGGKGMLAPAASGRFASNADRSTSKNESTPAMPAIHRIANSLVLNFIRRSLRDSPGRPTVELTRRREPKHPPPRQASYETRSRRSGPTICWASSLIGALLYVFDPLLQLFRFSLQHWLNYGLQLLLDDWPEFRLNTAR